MNSVATVSIIWTVASLSYYLCEILDRGGEGFKWKLIGSRQIKYTIDTRNTEYVLQALKIKTTAYLYTLKKFAFSYMKLLLLQSLVLITLGCNLSLSVDYVADSE